MRGLFIRGEGGGGVWLLLFVGGGRNGGAGGGGGRGRGVRAEVGDVDAWDEFPLRGVVHEGERK